MTTSTSKPREESKEKKKADKSTRYVHNDGRMDTMKDEQRATELHAVLEEMADSKKNLLCRRSTWSEVNMVTVADSKKNLLHTSVMLIRN